MDRNHAGVRRLIFTVWSAFSLLVLLVIAAMWVRSYYWLDSAAFPTGTTKAFSVTSQLGIIDIVEYYFDPRDLDLSKPYFGQRPRRPTKLEMSSSRIDSRSRPFWRQQVRNGIFGFYYFLLPSMFRRIMIPYWAIAILFAVCPVAWLLTRRRRRIVGCCTACGYDLRATPDDQGRYPLNYAP